MFTSLELEVEGSKVWQGDHWRTNVYITSTIQLKMEGSSPLDFLHLSRTGAI